MSILPPRSKLTGFSGAQSVLVPVPICSRFLNYFFPFYGTNSPFLHFLQHSLLPLANIEPLQLIRSRDRGHNINPCNSVFVVSVTLSRSTVAPILRSCIARLSLTLSFILDLLGFSDTPVYGRLFHLSKRRMRTTCTHPPSAAAFFSLSSSTLRLAPLAQVRYRPKWLRPP